MKLTVNGDATEAADGSTILALLEQLALTAGPVAVEVNRAIITRAQHASHALHDGDVVEIVHLVGGG
ncbi:sulfur carrier protein ThiS [soil metagenome]